MKKSEYSHVKRMNFCTEQVHSFVYTKSRETEIGVKMMNTLEIKNLTKNLVISSQLIICLYLLKKEKYLAFRIKWCWQEYNDKYDCWFVKK